MGTIYLSELMNNLHPLTEYKMHFAVNDKNDKIEPLDVYMRSFNEWEEWNTWSNGKNEFNRKYIFSLISFYPEKDTWLFGGIWEVVSTDYSMLGKGPCYPYTIELCEDYKNYIGRLKISYAHKDRAVRNLMESYFPELIVKEVLSEAYSIHVFPGYKNFDVNFSLLESAMENAEWKDALSIQGIYLITDTKTGKKYVGKASGHGGFWQRWSDYISDGHGGDKALKKLISSNGGIEYARKNYKFTILEVVESNLTDEIDDRESYWKRVLMTRMERVGLNDN